MQPAAKTSAPLHSEPRHGTRWSERLPATLLIMVIIALGVSGCSYLAVRTAAPKQAVTERSEAAINADALFWKTLHAGRYDEIEPVIRALQIAYIDTPGDAITAAHIGFMRAWQASERARAPAEDPVSTDWIMLARRYFAEAHALQPDEARFHGFLASMMLAEGQIHADEKLTRRGYFEMRDAIDAWPEFNLFTGGYVLSQLAPDTERFKEGLQWQWQTLDICAGETVSRQDPDYSRYMARYQTQGPQRVCWNSWIAPHNLEGFFMNMGDMLVKSGDWQTAVKIYQNAKKMPDFARWPYRDMLERRISAAQDNVSRFNDPTPAANAIDHRIMINSPYACMACHQATPTVGR